MKVLFLTTANNALSQAAFVELIRRGHQVAIELARSDANMVAAVERYQPDLILAPMLKIAIPEQIWRQRLCIIVHPGIPGDRGPSSLDWAIFEGAQEWGVTLLEAAEEMDSGRVWAFETFPVRAASKSSLYRNEVVRAAMKCLDRVISRIEGGFVEPEASIAEQCPIHGTWRDPMKQEQRKIDWKEPTSVIARKVRAGDGQPGVLDEVGGTCYFLYGAYEEDELRGQPGQILGWRGDAICRATGDGALWISHLRKKVPKGQTALKLPATVLLQHFLSENNIPELPLEIEGAVQGETYREIWYEERDQVGYLFFPLYNGAMCTQQCRKLLQAYRYACQRPTRVIALMGGPDFWSNGIDLNRIEAAANPADESWNNINAIDDLVRAIIRTDSHIVISAMQGSAGAGGAVMASAADLVYARRGIILNPHYKSMGGLYGSEYWTYLLPRRLGPARAAQVTEACLPMSTFEAMETGLIDAVLSEQPEQFVAEMKRRAEALAARADYTEMLERKRARRLIDEQQTPLESYRGAELLRMWENFYGSDQGYHLARQRFVNKVAAEETPAHLTGYHQRRQPHVDGLADAKKPVKQQGTAG